jgi:hypothetical protein
MTSLAYQRKPPFVILELDTVGPTLDVDVRSGIDPPDVLEIDVTSNEDLSIPQVGFVSADGGVFNLGIEQITPRSIYVTMPTVSMPEGESSVVVSASDDFGNRSVVTMPVLVGGARILDADSILGAAYDVDHEFDRWVELDTMMGSGFDVESEIDHAYEVDTTMVAEVVHA